MTNGGASIPPDWKAITEAVARELKGEPNNRLSSRRELRWGHRGSFQLTTDGTAEGRWKDWESGEGGRGAVSLVGYLLGLDRNNSLDWLRQSGHLSNRLPDRALRKPTAASVKKTSTDRSAVARSIWASGTAIPREEAHPARRWFDNRHLWRPELPTPPMLRWRAADSRHTGAGSIVVLLAAPMAWTNHWPSLPEPMAVQMIAIDDDGNAALDKPAEMGGLGKRTIGNATGAVVIIGNPMLSESTNPVRVAEGVADAFAIAARYDTPVVAVTGTSGMRNPELAAWLATAPSGTIIHADSDSSHKGRAPAGTTAAGFLRRAIADSGGEASAIYPPEGYKDAAEASQAAGFTALGDDWIEYARTLAETTGWPRWEIARIAQIATSGA
jgi:hypothetical protein